MSKIINVPRYNNYQGQQRRGIGYRQPAVRGRGECGPCIEGNNHPEGERPGKRRLYGTCVCDMHYYTPDYRMITKGVAIKKYGVTGPFLERMNRNGYLDIYRVPNPHNPGVAPPMKLIREYQLFVLITKIKQNLNPG